MLSMFIAIAVLLAGAILLLAVRRRAERDIAVSARAARITGSMPVAPHDAPDAPAALAAAEAVGSAMIQAGYSVETVQDVLGDIARVNGLPESEVLVFPNALLVSARGQGQHRTGAVATGDGRLLLSQIDEVQQTVDAARTGVLNPRSTIERIDRIHEMAPDVRSGPASARLRAPERGALRPARCIVDRRRPRRRTRAGNRSRAAPERAGAPALRCADHGRDRVPRGGRGVPASASGVGVRHRGGAARSARRSASWRPAHHRSPGAVHGPDDLRRGTRRRGGDAARPPQRGHRHRRRPRRRARFRLQPAP